MHEVDIVNKAWSGRTHSVFLEKLEKEICCIGHILLKIYLNIMLSAELLSNYTGGLAGYLYAPAIILGNLWLYNILTKNG